MSDRQVTFCCNGASATDLERPTFLEYRPEAANRNVRIGLAPFVRNVYHIPRRTLDLLEMAAYIHAADRLTQRGKTDAVEFHSWSRRFHMRIRVRDLEFWGRAEVQASLNRALAFMTGHESFSFSFEGGHDTGPTSLFDRADVDGPFLGQRPAVMLFSGGLDSLCGAVRTLANTEQPVILVSHQSQPVIKRVQRALVTALDSRFPQRVHHFTFESTLRGLRAIEETQRSRTFLYTAIGFAICEAIGSETLTVHENGVTSLNLPRREDMANARASRTTHPRAIGNMAHLLSLIAERQFTIATPFLWKTKRDVVSMLVSAEAENLITSTVSCTRTFQRLPEGTHCGECLQCLDRRLAIYAAEQEDVDDSGLYATDIVHKQIGNRASRTTVVDYVRQAAAFAASTPDSFGQTYLRELADLDSDLLGVLTDMNVVECVWQLIHRHGGNVGKGIRRMRDLHDDPLKPLESFSLLGLVATREYRRRPVIRLVSAIDKLVQDAIGTMFSVQRPDNERDLNSKMAALIGSHVELASEHPTVSFACAQVVPDHTLEEYDLLIECKYIRKGTAPSKASEGIAADLTKYPERCHILFLVYDPDRAISDDARFARDFENRGRCTVSVLR